MTVLIPPFDASLQNTYSGAKIIEIVAFVAACAFNEDYSDILKLIQLLEINIGQYC